MQRKPEITVIITVHNDTEGLGATIGSIQESQGCGVQVVVVDDGSDTPVEALISSDVDIIRQDRGLGPGLCRGRNAALKASASETILVCDAGILLTKSLIEGLCSIQRRLGPCIVPCFLSGYDGVDNPLMRLGLFSPTMAPEDELDPREGTFFSRCEEPRPIHNPDCWPGLRAMLCYPREAGIWCGGYDEDFDNYDWALEDIEFSYRLMKTGLPVVYSSNLRAYHKPHARNIAAIRKGISQTSELLLLKHPEMPAEVYRYCITHGLPVEQYIAKMELLRRNISSGYCVNPRSVKPEGADSPTLLVGAFTGRDKESLRAHTAISWIPTEISGCDYWLAGVELPFANKRFASAVVDRSVRTLPFPHDDIMHELSRVAHRTLEIDC